MGAFVLRMEGMLRPATSAVGLALLACAAFSASPPKTPRATQPVEVKIVSMPPIQPTEVKIVSTPPASAAEVKVVSMPVDESAHKLVTVTWVLVFANAVLCFATFGGSWLQSRDLRLRDRAAMEREIKRGAQRNMTGAVRLNQMALEIPALVNRMHRLSVESGLSDAVASDVQHTLQSRQKRLGQITDASLEIVSKHVLNFEGMSDQAARRLLGTVDTNDVELESMRDAITSDRVGYEREIASLLQNITAIQAAQIGRGM
jgi:hypothetical protein